VVGGDNVPGLTKEQMHSALAEKLKAAVPVLEKHRKTIILEPMNPWDHPDHCLYGSFDGIAVCEAVGSERVKLNWDLFHMQRYEGNLITRLEEGKDWIGYIQFADSPDRHEPLTGEVRWEAVFRKIREIGYTMPVGIECTPQDGDVLRAARRLYAVDARS
jgi:hydroxypyruvate isomerase